MRVTKGNFGVVAENTKAALVNEMVTRQRVERIEALLGRNFWGKLKWLFTGK